MKKHYIHPAICFIEISSSCVLCASNYKIQDNKLYIHRIIGTDGEYADSKGYQGGLLFDDDEE